jgi:hypothetical protein
MPRGRMLLFPFPSRVAPSARRHVPLSPRVFQVTSPGAETTNLTWTHLLTFKLRLGPCSPLKPPPDIQDTLGLGGNNVCTFLDVHVYFNVTLYQPYPVIVDRVVSRRLLNIPRQYIFHLSELSAHPSVHLPIHHSTASLPMWLVRTLVFSIVDIRFHHHLSNLKNKA